MQVSISKAAEMVGVTRATLYRHIDKKGIEVKKDENDNPKIDVSELERVYGDMVHGNDNDNERYRAPVIAAQSVYSPVDTDSFSQKPQSYLKPSGISAPVHSERLVQPRQEEAKSESSKRIEALEKEIVLLTQERQRERSQLVRQIDGLQAHLKQEQDNQAKLIDTIHEQKIYIDKYASEIPKEWDVMTKTVGKIQNQHKRLLLELHEQKNRSLWQRIVNR